MGSEDFAYMLQAKPGCFVWLGQQTLTHTANVHHPKYDFNDDLLAIGMSYWCELVDVTLNASR